MNIVVDTSVWSLVLRRKLVDEGHPTVILFRSLITEGNALYLVGPILQELLDGVASTGQFHKLIEILDPFPLIDIGRKVFIAASELRNHCRKKGIEAGVTDFLIAAACIETGFPLFTRDGDFERIAQASDLLLISEVKKQRPHESNPL